MTSKADRQGAEVDDDASDSNPDIEGTGESIAPTPDPMVQLQADMKAAKAEVAEWQDRFLRKAADLENFRKRAEKEKTDSVALARGSVLVEFLPLADACERALKSFAEGTEYPEILRRYQDGVELLHKQLLGILSGMGVVPLDTEGKKFDPRLHEALSREETDGFEEGTVVKELRRG
jgi:molecular chaperone GrpE